LRDSGEAAPLLGDRAPRTKCRLQGRLQQRAQNTGNDRLHRRFTLATRYASRATHAFRPIRELTH
jgi:hypothetical protein